MQVQPYVFFDGRCQEAIEFYKQAIGAKVEMLMQYKDSPEKTMCTPANENNVMHATLKIGDSVMLASDGRNEGKPEFKGFSLTITVPTEAAADKLFNALSEGGQVQMAMSKTFFAPKFGVCADKFGVSWMVMVGQ